MTQDPEDARGVEPPNVEPPNVGPPNVEPPNVEPPSVEQQRAELAATVEALAAKADVPTRVKDAATEQAHHLKDAATEQAHHLKGAASHQARNLQDRPEIIAAAVGFVVAVALILGIRHRRAGRRGLLP